MKIVCPSCQTSYDVAASSLGDAGRSVRCVRCRNVWFATPVDEAEPPAAVSATVDAGAVSAAASAYGRGAEPAPQAHADLHGEPAAEAATDPAENETFGFDVDPNLAARAADRTAHRADDADATAGWDEALAAHDAPPLAPEGGEAAGAGGPSEDVESVAARRARRGPGKHAGGRNRRPSLALLIAPLLIIDGLLVGFRTSLVRSMPQVAPLFAMIGFPVNLRGLDITDVTSARETNENTSILVIEGVVSNVSRQTLDVPRIRFALRNAAGNEVYTWTILPGRPTLAPGETEPFQTRLASPPAEGRDVAVRFFHRRDVTSTMR